jgi:transcriptional regulator
LNVFEIKEKIEKIENSIKFRSNLKPTIKIEIKFRSNLLLEVGKDVF